MESHHVECDLQSLRRLYYLLLYNGYNESIPEAFLLDQNTQLLLKRLLDSATEELVAKQSNVLAQARLVLTETVSTPSKSPIKEFPKSPMACSATASLSPAFGITRINDSKIQRNGLSSVAVSVLQGLTEEVTDSIERIETQLSALRFSSTRVDSDDRTRPYKSLIEDFPLRMPFQGYDTQRFSEEALRQREESFEDPNYRSNYMPMSPSRDDPTLTVESQRRYSHVRIKSRPPLASPPVASKKPSQSNRTSQKMASMKPTLLDQETDTWDEDQSGKESGETSSEDEEELFSTEQELEEASVETTGSSWETQAESITESVSSSPPHSHDDDDSEVSTSPPHTNRNRSKVPAKQMKKAMGKFKRLKEMLGQVFHHHHHHHHHNKEESRKQSAWKHLQRRFHRKEKEISVQKRRKSESQGLTLTTHKKRGGQFQALVKGMMRHRRHSNKQKHKLQTHVGKLQAGLKFPNAGLVKFGNRHYWCKKDQEHEEN